MDHILSLSYGKDSLACLGAIEKLGWPLDRIVTADIWATDTIPADLPPMVEFKEKADKIILDRYGITVEHICANRVVERERERESTEDPELQNGSRLKRSSIENSLSGNTVETSKDFLRPEVDGVDISKKILFKNSRKKLSYEDLFYRVPKRRKSNSKMNQGSILGWPVTGVPWCSGMLKRDPMLTFLDAPVCGEQQKILYCTLGLLRMSPCGLADIQRIGKNFLL